MTLTFLARFAAAAVLSMIIASVIASRPASGATLQPSITVESDIVTLGDLFADAGDLAEQPVFRSPDPGVEGALPATTAIEAARAAGLDVDPTPITSVRVVRRSVSLGAAEFGSLVAEEVAGRLGAPAEDVTVRFDAEPQPVAADGAVAAPASLSTFTYAGGSGRFRATISVDVGAAMRTVDLTGSAIRTIEVAVLARPIERGRTITTADVVVERRDSRAVDATVLVDPRQIVGLAARRPLRAGDMVSAGSVEPPRVVRRGDLVTLVFQKPGLALTARGRALADAAVGEPVTVLNEQSRRTVEGVAIGPDEVRVEPQQLRTAATATIPTVQ